MTIDNNRKSISIRLRKLMAMLLAGALIIIVYFTDILHSPEGWFTKHHLAGLILLIYILYYIFDYMLEQNYIYYTDSGDKIMFRYYSLRPLESSQNSIEIAKSDFHDFKVIRSFFNLKEKIVLYQATRRGIAKYPPISITALNKTEKEKLFNSLNRVKGVPA